MKIYNGNLFDHFDGVTTPEVDAIAHVCNCQGVMGSGIALAIKNKYHGAYEAYKEAERNFGLELGDISYNELNSRKYIFNLNAQYACGIGFRHLNYEALYVALNKTRLFMDACELCTIGIPFNMGCDRAGGDWSIVTAMVDSIFGEKVIAVKL